jgi:hypothetical protein
MYQFTLEWFRYCTPSLSPVQKGSNLSKLGVFLGNKYPQMYSFSDFLNDFSNQRP